MLNQQHQLRGALLLSNQWYDQKELKRIQKEWYQKLKAEGFDDIEDHSHPDTLLKTRHGDYFRCRYDAAQFEFKEEYYRRVSQFLHEYPFPNRSQLPLFHDNHDLLHKRILELHAEGWSFRKIAEELTRLGFRTNKDKINKIINELIELMRQFTPEQTDD